jgi:hypothetical protein
MANKRQLRNCTEHTTRCSVWEIPVSKLPDRASEVWGHSTDDHRDDAPASPQKNPKIQKIAPTDRAATATAF